ncbi:uncharacterized protein LOC108293711 isoform X2 [Cebus imitator]|uniref:uncharacterized protein LOC108293711 isoform X2 n=1 Tax=Cebus imitator TaxID=2715852 RepID=UPI00189C409B|nr:uncharacterized protein LOC108293711 isoform X2 [Cebus imitator]
MAQDGAVALRGPPRAATTDGRFFQATESPWSCGVDVSWHPWCTSCWRVAQDGEPQLGVRPVMGSGHDIRCPMGGEVCVLRSRVVAVRVSFHGTSTIRWQGRWSVFLGHKGPQSPRVQMAWIHGAPLLVHGSGWGSFLRGLLCAGPIDGRLFQGTESPWSRGVIVAWHPWCTSCWRVAQDGAVNHESSTTWWEGRWSILPPNGGHVESLIRRAMATAVHFMLVGGSGRGSCHGRPTTCRKEDGRFL